MNVEKLYALIGDLLEDYEKTDIVSQLDMLGTHLLNQVNAPNDPAHQRGISDTLKSVRRNLEKAPSNNFHGDWENMMSSLGIKIFYGKIFLDRINNIFANNKITPALALDEIKSLYKEVGIFQSHLSAIQKAFEYFGIDKDSLKEGECEVSIMIPRSYLDNKLDKLGGELRLLSKSVLRPFVEATGETPDGFSVRGVSSSDPIIYLHTVPIVAVSIMTAVKLALSIYKDVLDIKIHKKELEKLGIGKEALVALNKDLNEKIQSLAEKYTGEYLKKIQLNKQNKERVGRTSDELRNQVRNAILKLVKRFDVGFSINFRGEIHKTKKDEKGKTKTVELSDSDKINNEFIKEIQVNAKFLTYRNTEGPQIPELLDKIDEEFPENHDNGEK